MMGTYRPNILHRLGDAWAAFKAAPNPGMFYPPAPQRGASTGWISWEGWEKFEKQAQTDGQRDLIRAKTAITSPWVFADVQLLANLFSTSDLIIKERKGDKLEDVDNHPLELIWESPNEHMGRSYVMAFWAWSYILASKSYLYWVPDQSGTELMEVWPIPPWMIRPIPDPNDFIKAYAFKSSQYADTIIIPTEYITYSHSVNLFDVRDGMSFLAAAMNDINADLAMSMWNLNFFGENNGVPDGMISLDKNALDQDVIRVRMELMDFFGGTKRGMAVARAGDMSYQEFGRSQKEIQFAEGREQASKIVGRALGIPDGIWSELSNRANAEQALRTMISGAVWPLLVRLAEDMNAKRRGVVQRWYGPNMRAEFRDIRPDDKEAQRAELMAYQPFYTLNELREKTGQEAFPKDDVRGMMLVAEITKGAPLPGTPAAQLLEDLQAEKDEQAAQDAAAAVEAGDIPDPNAAPEEGAVDDLGEPLPDDIAPEDEAPEEELMPDEVLAKAVNWKRYETQKLARSMADEVLAKAVNDIALDEELMPDEVLVKAVDDLALWERKALKAFKRSGRAGVVFVSDAIDPDDHARISAALKAADSVAAVKAAFKRDATDTLLDSVDKDARAWAEEAMDGEH